MTSIVRSVAAIVLAASTISTASIAMAKGKPAQAGKSQVTGACMATGSTVTAQNKSSTVTARVAFKTQRACAHFLQVNHSLTVHSVTPGMNTTGLQPTGTTTVHGNSAAAQLCPARNSTGTVYFKTASSNTVGTFTFSNSLKSHGQCVSYFAQNKNLQIVTSPTTTGH
jgi:hypothetical protein